MSKVYLVIEKVPAYEDNYPTEVVREVFTRKDLAETYIDMHTAKFSVTAKQINTVTEALYKWEKENHPPNRPNHKIPYKSYDREDQAYSFARDLVYFNSQEVKDYVKELQEHEACYRAFKALQLAKNNLTEVQYNALKYKDLDADCDGPDFYIKEFEVKITL